jgi:hypothetical protein
MLLPEIVTISLGSCLACQLLVPNMGASYLIVCISQTRLSSYLTLLKDISIGTINK